MLAATGAIVLTCAAPAGAAITVTQRISVTASGQQANGESRFALISADGRYVAFDSAASNLVAGDANGVTDVFELDLATGVIERVNVPLPGPRPPAKRAPRGSATTAATSPSLRYAPTSCPATTTASPTCSCMTASPAPTQLVDRVDCRPAGPGRRHSLSAAAISADGRYVTFDSSAANLVAGDTNGTHDVFVRDRAAGTTQRVSVAAGGGQADDESFAPSISADGRSVAFASFADNLVPGDTNGTTDVFVRDRTAGTTTRVSVRSDGGQAARRAACSSAARAR